MGIIRILFMLILAKLESGMDKMLNLIPKKYIIILGLVVALGVSLGFNAYQHSRIEAITLQRDQNAAQLEFCAKQHSINQKVTHDYETELSALDEQLRAIRLRGYPSHTDIIPAGSTDAAASVGELSNRIRLETEWIIDFAGRCQKDALKLKGLQSYIKETRVK